MVQVETALLGVAVIGVVWIILLLLGIRRQIRETGNLDADTLSSALSRSWRDLEFDETVGRIETHADRLRGLHEDISALLRVPQHRGEFGEQQLDVILSDHLPPEMYGIRERVIDGTTPDAHIRSTSGLICIDSKFPLDNYEQVIAAESQEARDRAARQFGRDVEAQLEKIATDYVRPAAGT
ncbi:MAG: DNA recombination protein RmuC, partial [Halobacteriales archaeon]|nr:DNA recombination protein RmuC [Halobacteriales archaeon]